MAQIKQHSQSLPTDHFFGIFLFLRHYNLYDNSRERHPMIQQCNRHTVLPLVQAHIPHNPIIVEAGAFNGTDTVRLAHFWPSGTVHAFEPVPTIFAQLEQATAAIANIKRYPYALGEKDGTAPLYLSVKKETDTPHQASSLLKPKERLNWSPITYPTTIAVTTITLDSWMAQQGIERIDFLWLDVQGYALNILQASPSAVTTLKALYVEVEFVEAYEGQHQYPETRAWLESQGFTMVARDFTDTSHWFYGNALFCKQ